MFCRKSAFRLEFIYWAKASLKIPSKSGIGYYSIFKKSVFFLESKMYFLQLIPNCLLFFEKSVFILIFQGPAVFWFFQKGLVPIFGKNTSTDLFSIKKCVTVFSPDFFGNLHQMSSFTPKLPSFFDFLEKLRQMSSFSPYKLSYFSSKNSRNCLFLDFLVNLH